MILGRENLCQAHPKVEKRPAQPSCFGSNIEELFDHSYQRPTTSRWVWVPRARVLEAAQIGSRRPPFWGNGKENQGDSSQNHRFKIFRGGGG